MCYEKQVLDIIRERPNITTQEFLVAIGRNEDLLNAFFDCTANKLQGTEQGGIVHWSLIEDIDWTKI